MEVKNQNHIKEGYKNDCSVYASATVLEFQYPIIMTYGVIEKLASLAFIDKILSLAGAHFQPMYNFIARKVSKETGLNIEVKVVQITNKEYENLVNMGFYFGTGLLMGNSAYTKAVGRGVLTKKDIDVIKTKGRSFSHANVFGKGTDGTSIMEVLRGKEVKCSLEVLRYGVEQGVFRDNSRTFVGGDTFSKLVCNYLMQIKHDPDKEIVTNNLQEKEAMNKASEINMKYKWRILNSN